MLDFTRSGRGAEDQNHGGCHQRPGGDPPWEIDGGQPVPMPMLESRAFRMLSHPGEELGVRRMQQIPDVVVQPAQEHHGDESAHHRDEIASLAAAPTMSASSTSTSRLPRASAA